MTCNATNGFTAISLYYVNGNTAGQLRVYSGLNGSGTLLTSISLPQTPITGGTTLQTWIQKSLSHATAHSFQISGVAQYLGVDNIRITGDFPPRIIGTYPSADPPTASTATLHATVNPSGAATFVHFELDPDPFFSSPVTTAPQNIGGGTANVAITQVASGLARGTIYYFRVVASNETGVVTSDYSGLTTLQTAVQTFSASSVTPSSATLNGTATPQELSTDVHFQFATNSNLIGATNTVTQSIGSGTASIVFSAPISNLGPGVYFCRAVASNSAGVFLGAISGVSINCGYTASNSTTGTFTNISTSGTQVIGSGIDDDASSSINIGFTFPFFGSDKTNLYLSANGLLTFGSSSASGGNVDWAISTSPGLDAIAVLWDDWVTDAGVYVKTIGPVGQRMFVAQWNGHPYGGAAQVTFQAQLFEATGDILMLYPDNATDTGHDDGELATVGIRKNGAPANGRYLMWSYNAGGVATGTKLRFSPLRPIVGNLFANDFASNDATLHADVNPNYSPSTFYFEYGLTTSYGNTSSISSMTGSNGVTELVSGLATNLSPPATYHYRVVASNSLGVVTSPDATFYFGTPSIIEQPEDRIIASGTNTSFTVTCTGVPPLTYRWLFNNVEILDATNNTLALVNVLLPNAGDYQVIITNNYGSITSSVAVLTVVRGPELAAEPASRTNFVGTLATFTVSATGTAPLSYQWRKGGVTIANSVNIGGATSTALTLTNVQPGSAADYDVVVTNNYGSVTSQVATLTVVSLPGIATQPQSRTNEVETLATFSVSATGTAPLAYQWRKAGVNLVNTASISGVLTPSLSLANLQFGDAGSYDVVITNHYGSFVSLPAALTVTLPAIGLAGVAVRELPYDFHPGEMVEVRIQVTPPVGTTNWSVHEFYPDRWDLISATNASGTNEFTGELLFGPFTNDTPQTLTYEVLSNPGLTNSVNFAGYGSFNGIASSITGTTFLPSRNEWMFVGPQSLMGNQQVSSISGTAYGAGRWLASAAGWVTTLESGGRLTYPRCLRYYGNSRLAYLGGLFLHFGITAGTQYPLMTISDDGVSWKAAINEPGSLNPFAHWGQVQAVAYGNGTYVAVGRQIFPGEDPAGAIFSSTNGYSWRRVKRVESPWRTVNAVAFTNGLFIAVADLGTLLSSTNGLNWTEVRPIAVIGDTSGVWANRNLLGICPGPAGWIIPTSIPGTRLQSVDGVIWSELTGNSSGGGLYWQSFYADEKYWFSDTTAAYTTVDGTSWSLPSVFSPQPVGVVSRAPDGINPQYIGAGATAGNLVLSTNGNNWAAASLGGPAGWPRYLSVASVSNEWVVSGQGCGATSGENVPSDRPGKIWVPGLGGQVVSIQSASGQWRSGDPRIITDMLSTTNGLLAAGVAPGQLIAGFLTGPSFVLAQPTALPVLTRNVDPQSYKGISITSYAYGNASLTTSPEGYDLFAESYSVSAYYQMYWGHFTSTNGNNWRRRSIGLNDATNFPAIRGLAWGSGRYVGVSEGSSPGTGGPITSPNRIFTSTDGESYATVNLAGLTPSLNGEGLTGVAYANGRFVAIGAAGRILSSTNGLDWVTVRNSDGHRWNRVRYLDGIWAAVGNAGWVTFSPDGLNWTSKTAGAESDLTDIAHQNGQYMVVGSHAMVLVSLPVRPPVILTESLLKSPGAGLQFSISGHAGKVLDIQTSSNLVNWTSLMLRTNITGTVLIIDPDPNQERRFYRAVQQP